MQDAPIQCPADLDATEAEAMACEAPKPVKKPGDGGVVTTQGGGGGTGNPPQPPKKD